MINPNPIEIDREKGNFHYNTDYEFDAGVGLSEDVVKYISDVKREDEWVKDFRLKALNTFEKKRVTESAFDKKRVIEPPAYEKKKVT